VDNDPYGEIGCSMSKTNMTKRMGESTKSKVKNGGIPKIPIAPTLSDKENPYVLGSAARSFKGSRNGSGRLIRSATG